MWFGIIISAVALYALYRLIVWMASMPPVMVIPEEQDLEDSLDEDDEPESGVRVEPIYGALNPNLLPPLAEPYQGPFSNPRIDTFGPPAEHVWDAFTTASEPQPWLKPIEVISASPIETVVAPSEAVQQLYPDSTDTEE